MAEKIKKGFFKVLPWSVVILLIIGVSVGLLNSVPKVQPVKAGAGDGASSVLWLLDTNANGKIDRITFNIANPNVETWSLTGASPHGLSVTQAGADITISSVSLTTAANANPVGVQVDLSEADPDLVWNTDGVTASVVELIYTQAGYGVTPNIQDSVDEELNAIATGDTGPTDTEIDKAAPVHLSTAVLYKDITAVDGQVDRVDIQFSENIQLSEYDDADWSFPAAGDINLANESAATAVGNVIRLTVAGDANETGGATSPTVSYSAAGGTANSLKDNATAPNNAASFGPTTVGDGAAPARVSALYKDINGDGTVDRIDITMSADVGLACTWNAGDWSFPAAGTVNVTGSSACAVAGNDIRLTVTGTTAATTGGVTNPTVVYTNNASRVVDGATIATATWAAVTATDAAAPVPVSAAYKDADNDGSVERIDITMTADTGLACTWNAGDWSFPVAGTVNVTGSSACAVGGNDIRLTVTGTTAWTTGGVTNPTVIYTNNANRVTDGAANYTATWAAVTATDAAAPWVISARYLDNNPANGRVDRVEFTTTADTGIACTAFTGNADFTVGTAGEVGLASNVADTCASNGTSTVTISLATQGTLNTTGGATTPVVTYTQPGNGVEDGIGNDMQTAVGRSVTDAAAPVPVSALYKDADANGTVDRIDVTMTADVGLACTFNVADWSFPVAGTVNVTGSSACAISGNDIRLSVTGTTAATTGGVTNPTIIYTNNANRVTDGAANNTATWAAVTATDGAAPVPVSAVYQDWTGPDGQVDRIVLTMSNDIGLALTAYADLDWTITAGSVGLANETWVSAGGLGLTISTLGTANVTGGGVNPAVAYTNNANRLGDGSGNFTATFGAVAATDNAAPIIVNTYSTTTDTTGKVKAMDITFSESILDASVTPARFEFDNDSTNNATGEEAASGGSTNVTYPAVAAVANDQYYRLTVTTGITGTEVAYLHHNTLGLTDSSPAANQLALGDALGTENDEADPVIMTTSPANTATDVDVSASVALTFSEAMTTGSVTYTLAPNPGGVAVVWSGGNTIATYSHTAFNTLTLYTFTATAGDSAAAGDGALSAGPVANPFTFTTLAGGGGGGGGGGLPASVTVTAPNGGEILAGGGTYNIVWSAPGVSDTVSIYYSLDSGINFPNTIATAQTNDGSYTWTVPNISSSTVKIKAVSGSLNDISDSNFVITYTTPTVSVANSTIIASPTSVVANGTSFSIITVTVKDAASVPLSGKVVTLASSRGTSDTITTVTGTTGADGKATFNVYSSTAGTSTYTATAAGTVLTGTVSVVFTAVGAPTTPPAGETPTTLSVGDLIKSSLSTSVYYYGSDNKRHVFPNEKTYKSWYPDWAGIKTVTTSQLQGIALGANVKVRPGTVLVKIDTNPKVYAVEPNGLLRWVPTETRANTLYGSAWATKIIDVPLVFWVDYTFGSDISTDVHPTGALVKYTGLTDTYYIQGAEKRLIATESAFNANRFQWANVLTIPTTLSYANGTDVTAAEDALVRIY
jgi:hypothetical protein